MPSAVQGRPDQLGHAGIDDDLAPAAIADVEDARHEPARPGDERPTGLDRQPGRAAVLGHGGEKGRDLAREPLRIRGGLAERHDREAAADVERVERREPAAEQADHRQSSPHGVAPRVDRAQLRADVEVDPARSQRATAVAAEPLDERGRLGLGQPELRRALTDGQLGDGVGHHVRIEPDEDVERRSRTDPQPGAARQAGQDLGLVGRFEGDPQERAVAAGRGADRLAQVGIGLADTLERDPLVRDAGAPSDRPLAPRHDVGPEPAGGRPPPRSPGCRWP